jgi:hypothetical protein
MPDSCMKDHVICTTTLLWVPAHRTYRLIIDDGSEARLYDENLGAGYDDISQGAAQKFADNKTQEIKPHDCNCANWKFFAN